jgi:two-component system, OmpR family, sensor kinase
MGSLRTRLAISYAFLTAVALSIVVIASAQFALEIMMRPMMEAVSASASRAQAVVAADPNASTQILIDRALREAFQPGVTILRPPVSRGLNKRQPPPRPRGPADFNVKSALGIVDRIVPIHETAIIIIPDTRRTDALVSLYLEGVGIALVLTLVASWLIGRWISEMAIAPLRTVTSELRRFASGDFSQRPVTARDRSELGELTDAYNGATAQVTAAFAERKRVEEQMRRFIADAGHELRTPLTVIGGFLTILENGGYQIDPVRERAFRTLSRETGRMRLLVERMMVLARLERPDATSPSDVDLLELASDVISALAIARKGTVVLRRADDAWVYADPAELHEAISNLIDNALKYGNGTTVFVDVSRGKDEVALRVTDSGPGIPEADRARIFERFYRGERGMTVEGSGLGLAITARAAQRAGGSIVLESGDSGHTVFRLGLPIREGAISSGSDRYGRVFTTSQT